MNQKTSNGLHSDLTEEIRWHPSRVLLGVDNSMFDASKIDWSTDELANLWLDMRVVGLNKLDIVYSKLRSYELNKSNL